ncbi:MAG: trigger factor [Pirellulaceae bacterium]
MAATETENEATEDSGQLEAKPALQIDVKVSEKSTCERHVAVSVPVAEVGRYREQSFDEVAPKAELPGFRAGKAPRKLVETRFKDQIDEQVKSSLVMDSLQQVTEGDYFSAISEPDFDYEAVELPESGDFVFEFNIEVRPDFETPEWKGLELENPSCNLTTEHVDEHLSRTLTRFMPGEAVDGDVQLADSVTLNGKFKYEGKEIAAFEEETVAVRPKLAFGDAVLEGFDSLIVGKKEGDSFEATVTISESAANEELHGKEVAATFEIHEVKRIQVDEISPAMLENLGFDDTEELRGFVKEELERQFEFHQQQSLRKQIVEILTKEANWDLPESLVRRQTNRELQRTMLELQRSGFNQEQITSYLNASRMNARNSTVQALREHFVLEKIAEDLEIEAEPEDYEKEIELIAEQSDSSPRRVRARLEKTGQMDAIRNQIIERRVIDTITADGKLTDKEDMSFLKTDSDTSNISMAIAGDFDEIPEAKHDEGASPVQQSAKLPDSKEDKE